MSTIWGFHQKEKEHTLCCGKDCIKKFCTFSREHAKYIIIFKKKKMFTLTKEEVKSHQGAKVCYNCGKTMLNKFGKDKNHRKVRDQCHYTGKYRNTVHSICNLKCNVVKEFPVVFHNGSKHDYHFIIKELANEIEGQFECLGENKEKCKTFSVPVKKETPKIDKVVTKVLSIYPTK